eukprot:UN22080
MNAAGPPANNFPFNSTPFLHLAQREKRNGIVLMGLPRFFERSLVGRSFRGGNAATNQIQ